MRLKITLSLLFTLSTSLLWALQINDITTTEDFCKNGTITVDAQGGAQPYEYSLDGFSTVQTSPIFTNLSYGVYTVYVRDAEGNTAQSTANSVVVKNEVLALLQDPIATPATCAANNDGSAYMEITGGIPFSGDIRYKVMLTCDNQVFVTDSIEYIDNGNSTTIVLHKLPKGTYVGSIQDKGGCSVGCSFNIQAPEALRANIIETTHVKCKGDSTASIKFALSGGTIPYQVAAYTELNNPDSIKASTTSISGTEIALIGLCAAKYYIQITDKNGCYEWLEQTISEPVDTLSYTPYANSISCNGETNGKIFGSATGGTAPYTYKIVGMDTPYNDSNETGLFEGLPKGIYSAIVTDANGCIFSPAELLTVTEAEALSIDPLTKIPAATVTCKDDKTASVTFTIAGREQVVAPSDTARYYSIRLFDITRQQEIITPNLKYTNKFHPVLTKNRVEEVPGVDKNGAPIINKITHKDTLWTEGCHEITKELELTDYTVDKRGFDCDDKITISGLGAGAYRVSFYQGACQFGESVTFTVEVTGSLPLVQINDVANFCDESEYTISPTITATPAISNYSWTLGGVEIGTEKDLTYTFIAADNGRLLQLTTTNRCGTSQSNEVKITVRNRPTAELETDKDYLCQNQSANLNITFKGTAPFTYQLPDDSEYSTTNTTIWQQVTPLKDTIYTLPALKDAYCVANIEKDIQSTAIVVYPEPDYGMDIDIPDPMVSGKYVTITGYEGFVAYSLQVNGEAIAAHQQANTFKTKKFAHGTSNNEFVMNFTDKNGCQWTSSEVRAITSELFPNIFTPNGDGVNDILLADYSISIFDRNGNLLYKGSEGWDGTVNGKPANQGVYLYVIELTDEAGETFQHKQTVTLQR
ncbi:MAG: gliding motility-associated C-terminal domain-containing protein [Paludibacteraceae bacterium]|nr:gliding motility-associated C-terminal domain-containing protein [Paludibacteraceae bacterium]